MSHNDILNGHLYEGKRVSDKEICDNCKQLKMPVPYTREGCLNCHYSLPWKDWAEQEIQRLQEENERLRIWEKYASHLLDNHEGETITEENLQCWLGEIAPQQLTEDSNEEERQD